MEYRFKSGNEYNIKIDIDMWYLIAGKTMFIISQYVCYRLLFNFFDLNMFDRVFGWFLVEHLNEEYGYTAGKFFMINEDFRRLIKNTLVIIRNILFWSYTSTALEFTLLVLLIFISLINLKFCYIRKGVDVRVNRYSIKNKNWFFILYYSSIVIIVSFKILFSFSYFDLCFINKPVAVCLPFIFTIVYLYNKLLNFIKSIIIKKGTGFYYIFVLIKLFLSFNVLMFFIISGINFLCIQNKLSNNFIQEIMYHILFFYSYLFYIKF